MSKTKSVPSRRQAVRLEQLPSGQRRIIIAMLRGLAYAEAIAPCHRRVALARLRQLERGIGSPHSGGV